MAESKKSRTPGQQRLAGRKRNFATVVYPESAATGWQEILEDYHIQALISPLHDKDTNKCGILKKPHFHVLLIFDSPKAVDQIQPIIEKIGGVGCESVASAKSYARYLCHLDSPEKHRYSTGDVTSLGGVDYDAMIHLASDDNRLLVEIFDYIRRNQILSFSEFVDIAAAHFPEWFNLVVTSKAYVIEKYQKSLCWEIQTGYERKPIVDDSTGEIID